MGKMANSHKSSATFPLYYKASADTTQSRPALYLSPQRSSIRSKVLEIDSHTAPVSILCCSQANSSASSYLGQESSRCPPSSHVKSLAAVNPSGQSPPSAAMCGLTFQGCSDLSVQERSSALLGVGETSRALIGTLPLQSAKVIALSSFLDRYSGRRDLWKAHWEYHHQHDAYPPQYRFDDIKLCRQRYADSLPGLFPVANNAGSINVDMTAPVTADSKDSWPSPAPWAPVTSTLAGIQRLDPAAAAMFT